MAPQGPNLDPKTRFREIEHQTLTLMAGGLWGRKPGAFQERALDWSFENAGGDLFGFWMFPGRTCVKRSNWTNMEETQIYCLDLTVMFDGKVVPPRHKLVYEPTKESYNYHTLLPELFTNQIAVVRGSRLVGKMKPCLGGPNFWDEAISERNGGFDGEGCGDMRNKKG